MPSYKKTRLDYKIPSPKADDLKDYPRIEEDSVPLSSGQQVIEKPTETDAKMTINPYSSASPSPKSKKNKLNLTILGQGRNKQITMEGNRVFLNRDNTDPENTTISAKAHALLEIKNGQVFLSNQTQQKTTFVRVDGPCKIKSGDVILLGDRMIRVEFDDLQ